MKQIRLFVKSQSAQPCAGILSAFGIASAPIVNEQQQPCGSIVLNDSNLKSLHFQQLERACQNELQKQSNKARINLERYLHLRYDGTDFPLMVSELDVKQYGKTGKSDSWTKCFIARYKKEFGFHLSARNILVDDIRVRGEAVTSDGDEEDISNSTRSNQKMSTSKVVFGGKFHQCPVYELSQLKSGVKINGPLVVMCGTSTTIVAPDWLLSIDKKGDIYLNRTNETSSKLTVNLSSVDPVTLSIFGHRFMSIAEQMGRVLQRTAISTNIKERLDFSCALFGPDGGLVSNAPHIPVHLGAMQQAVQFQLKQNVEINRGDVILSNHPCAGGSHLPDLTIITPVFTAESNKPSFFLANRGHHADIGGLTPGSMPPMSTSLNQEGAQFISFKIVDRGTLMEDDLLAKFNEPAQHEGCTGSRNYADNLADLKAQIAANQRGIHLVLDLIEEYSLEVVVKYMGWIMESAEQAVRTLMIETCQKLGSNLLAIDSLDDGSDIGLEITINPDTGGNLLHSDSLYRDYFRLSF